MKQTWIRLTCLLAGLLFACACAAPVTTDMASAERQEQALSDMRVQYRDSSLVLSGICDGNHTDASGETCYDITVTEVYAGNAVVGDILHCAARPMQQGEEYMLFLSTGEDVPYAEDKIGYELVSEQLLHIQDSDIIWKGKPLSLTAFRDELTELSSVISAPAPVYMYDTFEDIVEAADEIFIGKVNALTPYQLRDISIRNGGSVEKAQYMAAIATVEAYGAMKGKLTYGQEIELVYCPEYVAAMLDAKTLQPEQYQAELAPQLAEGDVYVFFLISGPDGKQPYYFPVNPIQGYVGLQGDALRVGNGNRPLFGYQTLSSLAADIQQAMQGEKGEQGKQPLIVEE